jgi:hypothetical protein
MMKRACLDLSAWQRRGAIADDSPTPDVTPALGGIQGGVNDVHVAGATAKVADEGVPDLSGSGIVFFIQQIADCEELAGKAEPALERILFPECGLYLVL